MGREKSGIDYFHVKIGGQRPPLPNGGCHHERCTYHRAAEERVLLPLLSGLFYELSDAYELCRLSCGNPGFALSEQKHREPSGDRKLPDLRDRPAPLRLSGGPVFSQKNDCCRAGCHLRLQSSGRPVSRHPAHHSGLVSERPVPVHALAAPRPDHGRNAG